MYAIETPKVSVGTNVLVRSDTMLFTYPFEVEDIHIEIAYDVLIGAGVNIYVPNHYFSDTSKSMFL